MAIFLLLGWGLFVITAVVFARFWFLMLKRSIDLEYSIICILRDYESFKLWGIMLSDTVAKTPAKSNIDLSKRVLWLVGEFADYFLKMDRGLKKAWVAIDLWDFKNKMKEWDINKKAEDYVVDELTVQFKEKMEEDKKKMEEK